MRVALLSDRYPPDKGGLAQATERIARGLAGAGLEVDVYAVAGGGPPGSWQESQDDGHTVWRLGAHRRAEDTSADLLDRLASHHAGRPYDVIHGLYLVRSGFLAAYAGELLAIPSVVSARGNDLDRSVLDPARAAPILFALNNATRVTGVSAELARKAQALAPAACVELVPNAVDAARFAPHDRDPALVRALALAGREVVGFSGELRQKKGMMPLLDALAILAATRPVTLLAVGGVRADSEGALGLFRRLHPEVAMAVLPYRGAAELPSLYALMDVFVHPSLRDGMPNAVLEAMACARAVVGSTAGGLPDLVRDGVEGLLVPPGDAPALATALGRLLDDRARATLMGEAGRSRVVREFTPEAETRRYVALYRQACAAFRRSSGGGSARASR
jgi:glycosyltransferase involved in cell wall biosynthesis